MLHGTLFLHAQLKYILLILIDILILLFAYDFAIVQLIFAVSFVFVLLTYYVIDSGGVWLFMCYCHCLSV